MYVLGSENFLCISLEDMAEFNMHEASRTGWWTASFKGSRRKALGYPEI
jgi:hypothetical protein